MSEVASPISSGESVCQPAQVPGGGAALGPPPASQLNPDPCQMDFVDLHQTSVA